MVVFPSLSLPLDDKKFTLEGWHQARKVELEPIDQELELYDALEETEYDENLGQNYFKNALQNLSEGLAQMNVQVKPETKQIQANKKRIDDIIARVTRPSRRVTSAVLDENTVHVLGLTDENEKLPKSGSNLPLVQKASATPKHFIQQNDYEFRKDTTPSPRGIKLFQKNTFRVGNPRITHVRAPLSDFVNGSSSMKNYDEVLKYGAASNTAINEPEPHHIPRFKSINLITDNATQSGIFTTNLPEDEIMMISPGYIGTPFNINPNTNISLKEPSYAPKREVLKRFEMKPPKKSDRVAKKQSINKTPRTLSQILYIQETKKNERASEKPNLEDHMFKSYIEKSPQKSTKPPLQKSPSSKRYLLPAAADLDVNYYKIPRISLNSLQRIEGYEEAPILNLQKARESSLDPYGHNNRSITPMNRKDSFQDMPSGAMSKDPKEKEPIWKITKRKYRGDLTQLTKMKLKETLNGPWDRNYKKLNNAQLSRQIKSHLFN